MLFASHRLRLALLFALVGGCASEATPAPAPAGDDVGGREEGRGGRAKPGPPATPWPTALSSFATVDAVVWKAGALAIAGQFGQYDTVLLRSAVNAVDRTVEVIVTIHEYNGGGGESESKVGVANPKLLREFPVPDLAPLACGAPYDVRVIIDAASVTTAYFTPETTELARASITACP